MDFRMVCSSPCNTSVISLNEFFFRLENKDLSFYLRREKTYSIDALVATHVSTPVTSSFENRGFRYSSCIFSRLWSSPKLKLMEINLNCTHSCCKKLVMQKSRTKRKDWLELCPYKNSAPHAERLGIRQGVAELYEMIEWVDPFIFLLLTHFQRSGLVYLYQIKTEISPGWRLQRFSAIILFPCSNLLKVTRRSQQILKQITPMCPDVKNRERNRCRMGNIAYIIWMCDML